MKARTVAFVLTGMLAVYAVFMAGRAWTFISDGRPAAVLLGLSLLVLPLLAAWLVWREIRFGAAVQHLAEHLARTGGLPADDLPKRPSGRVVRQAADDRFDVRREEVGLAPQDPGAWYRLAVAYDDAGDRRRARRAMRQAVALYPPGDS